MTSYKEYRLREVLTLKKNIDVIISFPKEIIFLYLQHG